MRVLITLSVILSLCLFTISFLIFKMIGLENELNETYNRILSAEKNIDKEIKFLRKIKDIVDKKNIRIVNNQQAKFILVDILDTLRKVGEVKIIGDLKDNNKLLIYEIDIEIPESKVLKAIKLLKEIDNNVNPIIKIKRVTIVDKQINVRLELLQPYFRG